MLLEPLGPNSIRSDPLTTETAVSWSPWWCQPDTMPGSVRTSPAHMRSVENASWRSIQASAVPGAARHRAPT